MTAPPSIPKLDAANADPDAGTKFDFSRDLIGYGRHPPNAEWPGGAKIAVSFVINYEEVCHNHQPLPYPKTVKTEQQAMI